MNVSYCFYLEPVNVPLSISLSLPLVWSVTKIKQNGIIRAIPLHVKEPFDWAEKKIIEREKTLGGDVEWRRGEGRGWGDSGSWNDFPISVCENRENRITVLEAICCSVVGSAIGLIENKRRCCLRALQRMWRGAVFRVFARCLYCRRYAAMGP